MASASFSPVTGSASFDDGSTLDYDVDFAYLVNLKLDGGQLDIRKVAAPGEPGHGTQNFQGGSQFLEFEVIYVQNDETSCLQQFLNHSFALRSGTFAMLINGAIPFVGCILAAKPQATQPKSFDAKCWMRATFYIECTTP